jgi:hypothetical protein
MAAIGVSNRVSVAYVEEGALTYGTTPDNPAFAPLRITSESLNYGKKTTVSQELRSDRMISDVIPTEIDVAGDINFEWSADAAETGSLLYVTDPLLCAAIGSANFDMSSTDTLLNTSVSNGTTARSFTFQKVFNDLGAPVYVNYKGVRVGGMSLNMAKGSIITGSFKLMGNDASVTTTTIGGQTTSTVVLYTGDVRATMGDVTGLTIGNTTTSILQSLTMDINNNLRSQTQIGAQAAANIALGKMDLTGSFDMYFQNSTEYKKFLDNTSFALTWAIGAPNVLTAGNQQYIFTLPKCKYESVNVVAGGLDQDIIAKFTYRALYDPTSTHCITINKKKLRTAV